MNLFREIRERRILPAIGVYIGACWVVVEILDRTVERYFLSPYITDIVFWGLYSLIPAVLLLSWGHGRPGKDVATRAEKVGVPLNLLFSAAVLFAVFGSKDLSATADLVTVDNEFGQAEKVYIPRDAHRRRLAVFFFENRSGDPDLDWLQYGLTELLVQDLRQNPFLDVESPWNNPALGYYSKMKQAGFEDGTGVPLNLLRDIALAAGRLWFVEGGIGLQDGEVVVEVRLWASETLERIGSFESDGDLLPLMDRASEAIRDWLEVPTAGSGLAGDLPLSETYGGSSEALRNYIEGMNAVLFHNDWERSAQWFDAAIEEDPAFVMAWIRKGLNSWEQGDLEGARTAMDQARRLDYRLPESSQKLLKGYAYRMSGEHEKLEKFLRLQVRVDGDTESHRQLARFLLLTGRMEEAGKQYRLILEADDSDLGALRALAELERSAGRFEQALVHAERYVAERPEDLDGLLLKGELLLAAGREDEAQRQFEQAQLLEEPPIESTLQLALMAIRQGDWAGAGQLLDDTESDAVSPFHHSRILDVRILLEYRQGRLDRVIDLTRQQFEFNRQALPPMEQVFNFYVPMAQYHMLLDRNEEAGALLAEAVEAIQPPLNHFLEFMVAILHAQNGDFPAAQAALKEGERTIELFKADYLTFQTSLTGAEIARNRGEWSEAARLYADALNRLEQSPVDKGLGGMMSLLYGSAARMFVKAGNLPEASALIASATRKDPGEPTLWLARAMLQEAEGNTAMAQASLNYALAIWADADEEYLEYREALALSERYRAGEFRR